MSGIAAVVADHLPLDRLQFEQWARTLDEIGPDGTAVWTSDQVGLAHALLRVYPQDEFGDQPAGLRGSLRVVADARLDGVSELRSRLRTDGRDVQLGASDAELILHAYDVWGDSCLDYLMGDFAFILWDASNQRLVAAVDHFGVRRLYHSVAEGKLVISNWGAAVYSHPAVDHAPNDVAIFAFLRDGVMRSDATAFEAIRVLPAAHCLVWENGKANVHRYWTLPVDEPLEYSNPRAYEEEFIELLAAAVADRTRGQPTAMLLSGGLDSPAIAAVARSRPGTVSGLTGHTAVYEHLIPDDEHRFVSAVAKHVGIPVKYHAADAYLPYARATELGRISLVPVNSPFAAAFEDQLRAASADASVVLTGHGTDAILAPESLAALAAGSGRRQLIELVMQLPHHVRRYRRRPPLGLVPSLSRFRRSAASAPPVAPPWLRSYRMVEEESFARRAAINHPYRTDAYRITSGRWVPSAVGSFTPFAHRAHVTCAHPFIDLRVVRFCLRIPAIPWCWDKHLLRSAFRGMLPEEVLTRRKTPLQGDVLLSAFRRVGFEWLSAISPGAMTTRYYAWEDFAPLKELLLNDPAWQHSRPISLELFFQSWEK